MDPESISNNCNSKYKSERKDEQNGTAIPSSLVNRDSSTSAFTSAVGKKREAGIKPQPPDSLIKPLNLWGISKNQSTLDYLNASLDMSASISLPQLAENEKFQSFIGSNSSQNSSESSSIKLAPIIKNYQSTADVFSSKNLEQFSKSNLISREPDKFQPIADNGKFSNVPENSLMIQKSAPCPNAQSIISINDYDEIYYEENGCYDDEELQEILTKGIERSTTYPTTINELIDAETRITDS